MATTPHVVVQACFDESGKLKDTAFVAFGGCIFFPQVLRDFARKWEQRLKSEGLAHTSMKEAIHFKGPYLKWKNCPEKRDSLVLDLVDLLAESSTIRISAAISTDEFKNLSHSFREKMRFDPQFGMFEAVVLGALQGSVHPQAKVSLHIVCDLSEDFSEKCVSLFHLLRKNHAEVKDRCVAIGFADDEVHVGLQAADMVSYCARAHVARNVVPLDPLVEQIIARFAAQDRTDSSVFYRINGNGLGDAILETE